MEQTTHWLEAPVMTATVPTPATPENSGPTARRSIDLDWIEQKIDDYEKVNGKLGPKQRAAMMDAARRGETETMQRRHPLGAGAELGVDHRSETTRSAVAAVLREYFNGTLERGKINKPVDRSAAVTGAELADKMVSRLEVSNALVRLRRNYISLHQCILRHYQDGLTKAQIAERWHKSPRTVANEIAAALDLLVEWIYVDIT